MLYPYMTLPDETEIVHSEIINKDNKEQVKVSIERPVDGGFDSATCWLPDYQWEDIKGFSQKDIDYFSDIIHSGAHLLFEFARNGGFDSASNF
ncbi:MAG: hypothetical protein MR970_08855 [Spirochaetia bacterium]|nr:hypothetical protein [Spirochaetia bacterium]